MNVPIVSFGRTAEQAAIARVLFQAAPDMIDRDAAREAVFGVFAEICRQLAAFVDQAGVPHWEEGMTLAIPPSIVHDVATRSALVTVGRYDETHRVLTVSVREVESIDVRLRVPPPGTTGWIVMRPEDPNRPARPTDDALLNPS